MKGRPVPKLMGDNWEPDAKTRDFFRHLAYQNAIEYEGKGAVGSVIGRIMGARADLRQHGKEVTALVASEVAKANEMAAENGVEFFVIFLQKKHLNCSKSVK